MTIKELSKALGFTFQAIWKVLKTAANDGSEMGLKLKEKMGTSTKVRTVDYKIDEVMYFLKYMPSFSIVTKQWLTENFIHRDEMYYDSREKKELLHGDAKQFLFYYTHSTGKVKVCSTCTYLTARKMNKAGCHFSPYCTLYEVFLRKTLRKINIYKERCPSFEYTESKPLIFYENGVSNIDAFGVIENKTLGIDNNKFKTGKTKKGEVIVILK